MSQRPNPIPLLVYFVIVLGVFGYKAYAPHDHNHADSIAIRHVEQFCTLRANVFEEAARKAREGDFDGDEQTTIQAKVNDWLRDELETVSKEVAMEWNLEVKRISNSDDSQEVKQAELSGLFYELARAWK